MIPYGKVQLIKNQIFWNKSNGNFFKGINQPFTHCIVFWNMNKNLYFVIQSHWNATKVVEILAYEGQGPI